MESKYDFGNTFKYQNSDLIPSKTQRKEGRRGVTGDGFDLFPKRSVKRTIYLRKANPAATPPWSLLQNSSEIDVDNTRYHLGRSDNISP